MSLWVVIWFLLSSSSYAFTCAQIQALVAELGDEHLFESNGALNGISTSATSIKAITQALLKSDKLHTPTAGKTPEDRHDEFVRAVAHINPQLRVGGYKIGPNRSGGPGNLIETSKIYIRDIMGPETTRRISLASVRVTDREGNILANTNVVILPLDVSKDLVLVLDPHMKDRRFMATLKRDIQESRPRLIFYDSGYAAYYNEALQKHDQSKHKVADFRIDGTSWVAGE